MTKHHKVFLLTADGQHHGVHLMDTAWKRFWGARKYRGVLGFSQNTHFHTFFLKKPIWYCSFDAQGQPLMSLQMAHANSLFRVPSHASLTLEFTDPPAPGPMTVVGHVGRPNTKFWKSLFLATSALLLSLNHGPGKAAELPQTPPLLASHKKALEKHNLSVSLQGSTWVIGTPIETPAQLDTLAKVCQSQGSHGLRLDWQPGGALAKALPHALTPYWKLMGEPQLYLDTHNGAYALKGVRKTAHFPKTVGPFVECLLGSLPDLTQETGGSLHSVRLSLRFLELSRQKKGSSGLSLPTPPALGNPEEAFQGLLKALSERSYAKEIASPMVMSRSGETASLHVGGEVPIVHVNSKSQTVTYKPYGVELKVTPKLFTKSTVVLDFHLRVSAIENPAQPYPPAFTVREMTSRLTLPTGQVSVLGSFSLGKITQWSESPKHLAPVPTLQRWFTKERSTELDAELWITLRPEPVVQPTITPEEELP